MPLSQGDRLGRYQILARLGAGGMGEVYRARDTELDRDVAIKVLAEHLAESPELRQRLEREAKAVSSLSHPNVCTLYDVGHGDGFDYLVMEYLEGRPLAERLAKRPLPTDEVLRIGTEIANALEAAHRAGIVHRDLKPSNIMLTRGGAKLLDFGLAKVDVAVASVAADQAESPTLSRPITAEGTILGTYVYMAPEQLEGKEVDARTDIFAFGAVLHEMATGQRAFFGDSPASLIGAIMHEQPRAASQIQPLTPPALDRVIQGCLAKDPDDRWQTAHDVALQLRWIAEEASVTEVPVEVTARLRPRERLAWAALGVAAVAAIVIGLGYVRRATTPDRQIRLNIVVPQEFSFVGSPRISSDGRTVAFRATQSGVTRIWLRDLGSLDARPLLGTESTMEFRPIWSPDSRFIAFFSEGKLKKIAVDGGPPQTICDAPTGFDGSWGATGEIVFDAWPGEPIRRVAEGGGFARPDVAVDTDGGERSVGWPEFLPDGRRFLHVVDRVTGEFDLMLAELGSDRAIWLAEVDSRAQYADPGYLLYVRENTLMAHPFDHRSGEVTGEPKPLIEGVTPNRAGLADFSASTDGTLVYRAGSNVCRLVWRHRDGGEIGTVAEVAAYRSPCLAPGGDRLVVEVTDARTGNRDLWMHDLDRAVATRFTFDPGEDLVPVWSPDGTRIAFSSHRRGSFGLYAKDATGTGDVELLLEQEGEPYAMDWSGDGRFLAYTKLEGGQSAVDVWALPMEPVGEPFQVLHSPSRESGPAFSPDARWLAYVSDESGRSEVYVTRFPGPDGKWQVSTAGGTEPRWSSDGHELYFLDATENIVSVAAEAGESFSTGPPRALFDARLCPVAQRNHYVVAPDGERFLVNSRVESETNSLTVVQNWSASLEP